MIPGRIKLFWLVALVLVFATGSVSFILVSKPQTEADDLYRTYAAVPGIDATFLRNFPINDTLTIDVTILQATDSAGWERLIADFHIPDVPDRIQQMIDQGQDLITIRNVQKSDPTLPADIVDVLNNNVMATSRLYWTVCIFYTETEAEQDAVSSSQWDKNKTIAKL